MVGRRSPLPAPERAPEPTIDVGVHVAVDVGVGELGDDDNDEPSDGECGGDVRGLNAGRGDDAEGDDVMMSPPSREPPRSRSRSRRRGVVERDATRLKRLSLDGVGDWSNGDGEDDPLLLLPPVRLASALACACFACADAEGEGVWDVAPPVGEPGASARPVPAYMLSGRRRACGACKSDMRNNGQEEECRNGS